MRESGDLIHQTERVKVMRRRAFKHRKDKVCLHENDKAVAEHLPCILLCVYVPELDPLVPNDSWPCPDT